MLSVLSIIHDLPNTQRVNSRKFESLKWLKSHVSEVSACGQTLTKRVPINKRKPMTEDSPNMDAFQSYVAKRYLRRREKNIPPIGAPEATIPIAKARYLVNQGATIQNATIVGIPIILKLSNGSIKPRDRLTCTKSSNYEAPYKLWES